MKLPNKCGEIYVDVSKTIQNQNNLGVFAGQDFKKGDCVEMAPFIQLKSDPCPHSCINTPLNDYLFSLQSIFFDFI